MITKKLFIATLLASFVIPGFLVYGQDTTVTDSFKKQMNVGPFAIEVPTVVEIELSEIVAPNEKFLIEEAGSGNYLNYYLKTNRQTYPSALTAEAVPLMTGSKVESLVDGDLDTSVNLRVANDSVTEGQIVISSAETIRTSRIDLRLASFVSLPQRVKINYLSENTGEYEVAVAERTMSGTSITFPEISSTQFVITLTYSQPLRISEVVIQDEDLRTERKQGIRFLAQPNTGYEIYYESSVNPRVRTIESGNLTSDQDVLLVSNEVFATNPFYIPVDQDDDGVPDTLDNCVSVANTDQLDIDRNGRGDSCDDFDRDGVANHQDNCVEQPNRAQTDTDGDGIGDACDEEESRFTEANPWVPWFGMGMALLVIMLLFIIVITGPKPRQREESQ
jgi:hypothetical protein